MAAAPAAESLIADLSALAAVGYALAGGVGAAVLAVVAPMLMHNYTAAAAADQVLIAAQFAVLFEVVWRAIWQFLDGVLLAAWWLGIGRPDPGRFARACPGCRLRSPQRQ